MIPHNKYQSFIKIFNFCFESFIHGEGLVINIKPDDFRPINKILFYLWSFIASIRSWRLFIIYSTLKQTIKHHLSSNPFSSVFKRMFFWNFAYACIVYFYLNSWIFGFQSYSVLSHFMYLWFFMILCRWYLWGLILFK